jgi:hypothetical protein
MGNDAISLDEVLVYRALLQNRRRWITDRQLAQRIEGVTARSIRAHGLKLMKLGLVEQPATLPARRYRLSAKASRDHPYVRRLEHAAEVFELSTKGEDRSV